MKNQVTLNKPFKLEYQTDKHNVNDITQGLALKQTEKVTAWIPKSIFCNLDNWFDCDVTDEYGNLLKNENQFKCFELPYFITINEKQQ